MSEANEISVASKLSDATAASSVYAATDPCAIGGLSVAVGQMDVIAGNPQANLATMRAMVAQAKEAGADLIVFPEMCVGGYFLADKWTDESFVDYLESLNDQVRAMSDSIGIIFGNVVRSYRGTAPKGTDGRRARYNAALFAQDGQWVPRQHDDAVAGVYLKSLLPNYRMFDDDRYFVSSLEDAQYHTELAFEDAYCSPFLFMVRGTTYRIGLEICEDLWSGDYAFDVTGHYQRQGCDLVVNISASPWTLGKDNGRAKRVAEHVAALGSIPPLLYVNNVGMQNNGKNVLSFDGGSALYGSDGRILHQCPDTFTESCEEVNWVEGASSTSAASCYENDSEKILDALVHTLRRFDQQIFPFKPKWIIGLSGGIDSSITACLLRLALSDPSRIIGYNLATRYNSDITKANAYNLAQALGITLKNGSIEAVVGATEDVLRTYGYADEQISGLAQENIQARLRGHMLSTFAGVEGGVIMNNGNKIEVALGYATLYGDAIGAISPLGDLTKVQLFDLARAINRRLGTEAVPENLIPEETDEGFSWETMPSAELKDAQVDPMKWFYHDWLIRKLQDYPGYGIEKIMRQYLKDKLASTPVAKWIPFYGLDDPEAFINDLEWVLRQLRISVFKRIQMPPIITISRGSFGFDFRENQAIYEQTPEYCELKEAILQRG